MLLNRTMNNNNKKIENRTKYKTFDARPKQHRVTKIYTIVKQYKRYNNIFVIVKQVNNSKFSYGKLGQNENNYFLTQRHLQPPIIIISVALSCTLHKHKHKHTHTHTSHILNKRAHDIYNQLKRGQRRRRRRRERNKRKASHSN